MQLNILPSEIKNEIKLNLVNLKIKNILLFLTIITCVCGISYLFGMLFIQINYYNLIRSSDLLQRNVQTNTTKIKEVNSQMASLEKIQNEFVYWSNLLKYFSENLGSGIKINQIRCDKVNKTFAITGFAFTRDDLLAFKNKIEETPFLDKINFPIKNLLERENIIFEITAQLKSYEF